MPIRSKANAFRHRTFKNCGVNNGSATTFVHSKKKRENDMIKVLGHTELHKWLGCMLCGCPGQDFAVETAFHLQQAAKALQKHRWMLQCEERSIKHRLRYFEASVSSTACFPAAHRPVHSKQLHIRRTLWPPPGTNWSGQWHDVLHEWNMRVDRRACASGILLWSKQCMIQYWNFALYIANLPAERWVKRAFARIHSNISCRSPELLARAFNFPGSY